MNYLIDEQSALDALQPLFTELRAEGGMLAVDTEFLREKTYHAKLCLVQLGIGEDQYCIDVLAIADLSLLEELFIDTAVVKLFHAARQDMEVIWQSLKVLPKPVFDTQLAAAFCGMDLQLGHTALVAEKLGVELSKSQARTDWTRRPLTSKQLEYAAEDVAHLVRLHALLKEALDEAGKFAWFEEEIEDLYEVEKYDADPAKAYQRLSGGNLNLQQQYVLQALAEWRESMAKDRDIPRSWVVRDDKLYELATKLPTSADEIIELGIFGRRSAPRFAPQAARIIGDTQVENTALWRKVDPLDKQQKGVVSVMMNELKEQAQQQEIAQGLLATRRDVESLFRHGRSDKLLSGWRENVIGNKLLNIAQRA